MNRAIRKLPNAPGQFGKGKQQLSKRKAEKEILNVAPA